MFEYERAPNVKSRITTVQTILKVSIDVSSFQACKSISVTIENRGAGLDSAWKVTGKVYRPSAEIGEFGEFVHVRV